MTDEEYKGMRRSPEFQPHAWDFPAERTPVFEMIGSGIAVRSPTPVVNDARNRDLGLIANLLFSREKWIRSQIDKRRDYDKECGYPDEILLNDYHQKYERDPIANRIMSIWAKECWQVVPEVKESEDPDVEKPFEEGLSMISAGLRLLPDGKPSKFKGTEGNGNALWGYCRRLHEQACIGSYACLMIGFDDITEGDDEGGLAREVTPGPDRKVLFLRVLPERSCPVKTWDKDRLSPRYGQPLTYEVTLGESVTTTSLDSQSATTESGSFDVHWTRMIHFAANLTDGEVTGPPVAKAVFNNILNLGKLYGGSAEMYWQGAFFGISFETDPSLGGDVKVNLTKAKNTIEDYFNTLQRYIIANGFSAKPLAPQVVSPKEQIEVQIKAICIYLGCPVPVFEGYEIGEQASQNNDSDWNDRVKEKQENVCTPGIVVPLIDRLQWAGALPEPEQYTVKWPDIYKRSEKQKAEVGLMLVQALRAYVEGGVETVVELTDLFSHILGLPDAVAKKLAANAELALENAMSRQEELAPEPEPMPAGAGFGGANGNGQPAGGNGRPF
jgi:hypothetical protein